MEPTKYDLDLTNKTYAEVADLIAAWREDEDALACAAFDLLNSIEPFLRQTAKSVEQAETFLAEATNA